MFVQRQEVFVVTLTPAEIKELERILKDWTQCRFRKVLSGGEEEEEEEEEDVELDDPTKENYLKGSWAYFARKTEIGYKLEELQCFSSPETEPRLERVTTLPPRFFSY